MYRKILVPLDGSRLAERVLPHAEALARCTGAELILLRVLVHAYEGAPAGIGPYRRAPFPLPPESEELMKEATAYLRHKKDDLARRGVSASIGVEEGGPVAEAILRFAHKHAVDMIAMCTHGYTGLPRAIFGSVAEAVLHGAEKPVFLITSACRSGSDESST